MRSGVLAAVVAFAVGCSTQGGLEFELDASADPTADAIAVYVGGGKGIQASIATRGKAPMFDANYGTYFPDAHGSIEIFDLAGSRTKTLSLVPGTGATVISIVAVGMTGDRATSVATLTTVPLDPSVILVWKLELKPLENRSVVMWGEKPEDKTCVQVTDHSIAMEKLQNVYVGIEGDRDCDGYPEKLPGGGKNRDECDDDWHRARSLPSISTLSCMENQDVTDSGTITETCVVGAPICEDGKPDQRESCSHGKPFCAPNALCERCMMPDPEERLACALALHPKMSPQTIPYVRCELELDISVMPRRMCPTPNRASPPVGWFGPVTASCVGPPLFHTPDRMAPWSTTAELGGISLTFANNPAAGSCGMQISSVLSTMNPVDPTAFPAHGLVAVELASGRGVVAPVVFELVEVMGCDNVNRDCMPASTTPEPSIQNCLKLAPVSL